MSATTRARSLWRDWCTATGHDPDDTSPAALAAFAGQVPGVNPALVPPPERRDPWAATEKQWKPVDASLANCPAYGWPVAVAGRRDAWLIVAARVLRLPRLLAVSLRAHDLPSLVTRLPEPAHATTCVRCVSVRWLDVVVTYEQWSRSAVRNKVWSRPAGTWSPSVLGSAVPCDRSCDRLPALIASLPGHTVITPAIDRHGWWAHWRPMSPRAMTSVLASRCDPYAPAPDPEADPLELLGPTPAFDDTTFDRLDAAIDAADEVNRRLEALLGEFGA